MKNNNEDKLLEIIYDHYKDTCNLTKESVKYREKLLVYLLIIIFLQFVQISLASNFLETVNSAIQSQIGINCKIGNDLVEGFLWFLFFSFSLRYFQSNIYINRLYSYSHILEGKINQYTTKGFITREGQEYLKNYPKFLDWINFVYTWTLPIFLIILSSIKVYLSIITKSSIVTLHISILFLIGTLISIVLYLLAIHKNS